MNDFLNWAAAACCFVLAVCFHTRRGERFFLFFENIRPEEAGAWHVSAMRRYVGKWMGVVGAVCALRAVASHLGREGWANALVIVVLALFFYLAAQRPRFRREDGDSDRF